MSEKKELIKKLESIWILHNKALSIKQKMEDFVPEDHYERKVVVPVFPGEFEDEEDRAAWKESIDHSDDDAIEQMEIEYDRFFAPQKPAKPEIKDFDYKTSNQDQEKKFKFGCLSSIAGAIGGFFLLSLILGTAEGAVGTIVVIALLATCIFVFFRYKLKQLKIADEKKKEKAFAEYTAHKEDLLEEYKEKERLYQSECISYKLRKADFLEEYSKWREIYLEREKEEDQIKEKLEADRVAAVEKIEKEEFTPILEEIAKENGDLITTNYLPALGVIIDLLKSGRADNLKEAINRYEEMRYRERQLQLQREQEEQRRLEEERRRADEERRHQEEMSLRRAQERQRQYEEEKREKEAERRHQEELKQREQQERSRALEEKERIRKQEYKEHMARIDQERKQRDAASRQCRACIHAGRCNMQGRNEAPNCTGFRPR